MSLSRSSYLPRLEAVRKAARAIRASNAEKKNAVLKRLAALLETEEDQVLLANEHDLKVLHHGFPTAFRDRLELNPKRLAGMRESLLQVAALPDPTGETVEEKTLSNGLKVRRIRAPLGVIYMIFESRPNVAIEAFSLAFKSGNAVILRGGKESMKSTAALYALMTQALKENGFEEACLWGIEDPNRDLTLSLLKEKALIDVVVPRGGDSLIEFVVENSRIPIIKNDRGLCHIYVDEKADLKMAGDIVINAKTQRPGVCNSMETLLVHRSVKDSFLSSLYNRMKSLGVEWRGDAETLVTLKGRAEVIAASPEDWDTEHLALIMNAKVVGSLEEAISHIDRHGSRHSESIITSDETRARLFQSEVDAAAVYWNASTRFTDGFALGLGGELGISTQKLHVRGPVGLKELTSLRWVIDGNGQIRPG